MTKTEYAKYLQSDHWRERRKLAIDEANNECEKCQLPRWVAELVYDQDLHVHHRSYARLGRETYEDLEVLCRRCHEVETFGRSELKLPKRAECELCGSIHWNYRNPLCAPCDWLINGVGSCDYPGFNSFNNPRTFGRPVWYYLCQKITDNCYLGSGSAKEAVEFLKEAITQFPEQEVEDFLKDVEPDGDH